MDINQYWDHQPGDTVMTVDGYPGEVKEVTDGPVPGNEDYLVELHNGLGGGHYSSGQLTKLLNHRHAAEHAAAGLHVASEDYPELGEILYDRPDPGKMVFQAGSSQDRQDASAEDHDEPGGDGAQLRDTDQPDSCSYCGATGFTGQTDNGRVKQATCGTCGGTMSAHPGAQWTPELIGDPSNHPSTAVDPASGASQSGGQAGINDLIDFDSRVSKSSSLHEAGAKEDEQIRQSGLPLLSNDDKPGERFDKLSQHYEHLSHRYEDNSDYADEDHPLAAHHREHGVPRFGFRTLADTATDAKAAVATHLSDNIRRMGGAAGHPMGWPSVHIEHPGDNTGLLDRALGQYGRGDITIRHDLAHDENEGGKPTTPWFSKSGARSTLGHITAHEFGHFMDDKQFGDNSLKSTTARAAMLHEVSRHIPGAEPFHGAGHGANAEGWVERNREHIVNHVGTYAATSPHELIAELYAEHHHSPNPSPAAQAVGRHLEGTHDDEAAERRTAAAAARRAEGQEADARGAAGPREGGAGFAEAAAGLSITAMPSRNHPEHPEGIRFKTGIDPYEYENEQTHPGWQHRQIYAHLPGSPKGQPDGILNYSRTPEDHPHPTVAIHMIKTYGDRGQGVGSAMMDELRSQHPAHMFDHGAKSPSGQAFLDKYEDPAGPHMNLDHPANAGLEDLHRPTDEAKWRARKNLDFMGAIAGHDWCTWRREARCTFPGDSTAVSLAIPQDRGPCPWETPWQQQVCPISEPGPMALMHAKGSLTAEGAIPPGPCAECGGKGHYDIEEENPDFHGEDGDDPDAYRMRRDTCEVCGGSGIDPGMTDEELDRQRTQHKQDKADDHRWHMENIPHPGGFQNPHYCGGPKSSCDLPKRPPGFPSTDADWIPRKKQPANPGGLARLSPEEVEYRTNHQTPERKKRVEEAMKQRAEQLARQKESRLAPPDAGTLLRTAARDTDLGFHVTATWADVQRKAKRIRAEGGVTIVVASNDGIGGQVKGDKHTYEAILVFRPGTHKVADWTCGCAWAAYAFDRSPAFKRFEGRKCSHALALQFEAQSQGMFGKEIHESEPPRKAPTVVKYDPDSGASVFARPYEGSLAAVAVARLRAEDVDPGEVIGILIQTGLKHTAARDLWKSAHAEEEHEGHHEAALDLVDAGELGPVLAAKDDAPGPKVSGIALKAHDTGRVLMLQRGLDDEKDPAAGTWEFPGGHHEDGDLTSLHAGIREWTEEVGQEFPANGAVKHTWTSPNGVYQGHVVVVPSEKDLSMKDGRVTVNPDDPKGDHHEQAAWWSVEHAKKNPALRTEVKAHTPWKEIEKASLDTAKTASSWDPISNTTVTQPGRNLSEPEHSTSKNPVSTGFATSDDPSNWDNLDASPVSLTTNMSFDSTLHAQPEPALPSTDGGAEYHPEFSQADLDPVPDDPAQPDPYQSTPGITLQDGGSATPNSYHSSLGERSAADIVADFQKSAAAQALMEGAREDSDDIAAAAKAHLTKQALADFSPEEQRELINEGADGVRARNFANLQIDGTHYALLEEAMQNGEVDPSSLFL